MSLEKIKMDLEKDIADNKSKVEAWKKVTYPTKKDGTPFKIMSKNFDGATYGKRDYYSNNLYLKTTIECNRNNSQYWINDNIYCGDNYKEDTLEEIKEKVLERIEYLKDKIESKERQLEIIDNTYEEFKKTYSSMCQRLKDLVGTDKYGDINDIGRTIYQDIVESSIF